MFSGMQYFDVWYNVPKPRFTEESLLELNLQEQQQYHCSEKIAGGTVSKCPWLQKLLSEPGLASIPIVEKQVGNQILVVLPHRAMYKGMCH